MHTKKNHTHDEANAMEQLENKNFRKLLIIDLSGLFLFAILFGYLNSTLASNPNLLTYNIILILVYGSIWYYFIDRKYDGVLYQGLILLLAVLIIKSLGIGR